MGTLGMWLFLGSLTTLFAPFLITYLLMRGEADTWPPPGFPDWPRALWLSTALLIATSLAMHAALRTVRRPADPLDNATAAGDAAAVAALRRTLLLAALLAIGFLICQTYAWGELFSHPLRSDQWRLAGFAWFFMIIHAMHVVGGVAALGLVVRNALHGRYSRASHEGVRHCAMYWHFIDVVWIVMFAAMFLPT